MRRHSGFVHSSPLLWLFEALAGLVVGLLRFAWRWSTGAELDGEPRTDATFLAPGERALTKTGRASRWSYLPRMTRAAIRHAVVLVTAATLYGLVVAPTLTRIAWCAAALTVVAVAARRGWQAWQARQHRERYVIPVGAAVGGLLGLPAAKATDIEKWLDFPVTFFDETVRSELRVAVSARQAYDDKVLKAVEQTIARKAGRARDELDFAWHMVGANPYLSVQVREACPKLVRLEDIRHMITSDDDGKLPLGLGVARREVAPSLTGESPHIGFSCMSGTGKSETTKAMIAVALHKGYQVGIIDLKIESQMWARGLAGVAYADSGKAGFDLLIEWQKEMHRRQQIVRNTPPGEVPDIGKRMVLFFEEQNIGMAAIGAYWDNIKNEPEWKGKKNPAVAALFELSCAGRSMKEHLVSIAQYFDVPGTCAGKGAIRQNYGVRIIRGKYEAWDMLAKETKPYPRPPKAKQKGRMHIVVDSEAVEFQSVILTDEEALELATTGQGVTVPEQWTAGDEHGREGVTAGSVTADEGPARYTLAEAVKAGFVGEIADEKAEKRRYDWLRQRKNRDRDNFPEGVTMGGKTTYTEADIRGWYEASTLAAITEGENKE